MLKYLKNIKIPKIFMDFFFWYGYGNFWVFVFGFGYLPKTKPRPKRLLGYISLVCTVSQYRPDYVTNV